MAREEYLAYMKEYNKMYKQYRVPTTHKYILTGIEHLRVEPNGNNFIGLDPLEPVVCSQFNCPNHLSKTEQLFGTKCVHCQDKKKIDVAMYLSFPVKKVG